MDTENYSWMNDISADAVRDAANLQLQASGQPMRLGMYRGVERNGFQFLTSTYTVAIVVVRPLPGSFQILSILKVIDRTRSFSWLGNGLPGPFTQKILMGGGKPQNGAAGFGFR